MRGIHAVGQILDAEARLQWKCDDCGAAGFADPASIAAAKGADFSLIDQHPPCRRAACLGRVTFYVGLGMRWQPMRSAEADARALKASCYPEARDLHAHGWRIAAGLWRPPVRDPGRR